jgi:phosphomannomutase
MKNTSKCQQIDFKTTSDGWRGQLTENFTTANVLRIANALSLYVLNEFPSRQRRVVLGYDTRFTSINFRDLIAQTMGRAGIDVYLLSKPSPTPVLTYLVKTNNCACGVMITASHNPPLDNGIKVRMNYGGPPTEETVQKIESYLDRRASYPSKQGKINVVNIEREYVEHINQLIFISKDRIRPTNILVDTMHGTTDGLLAKIFQHSSIKVDYINNENDPYFGGIPPEPKYESTKKLQSRLQEPDNDMGIAHDGDGDRIVAVLPEAGYLSPHDVSALILWYLVVYRKQNGLVLGSQTLGRKLKMLSQHFGLEYRETSVGFWNMAKIMLEENVLMAAEENGGIGLGINMPERDCTLIAALLIEANLMVEGGLEKIFKDIEKVTGPAKFIRQNYICKGDRKKIMTILIKDSSDLLIKNKYEMQLLPDGLKVIFLNNDSVTLRLSGTENLIRIYVEADNREQAEKILKSTIGKLKRYDH